MKKSRAQLDAEKLAALDAAQKAVDTGEVTVDQAEAGLNIADGDGGDSPRDVTVAPHQEPIPPAEDIEDIKRQLEKLKRTLSHTEQELNPTRTRAQQLERQVEELRAQLAAHPPAPEEPTDYGLTEEESEFDTVKTISEKVAKATMSKLAKRLEEMSNKISEFEGLNTQRKIDAKISEHRAQLAEALGGQNPDELFNHPKIVAWAEGQPEEEQAALHNPLPHSARFVASILARFKAEVERGQVVRKPSHGESGVPSRVAPDTIAPSAGMNGSDPVFNHRTFESDVQKLISSGKTSEAQRLVEIAEKEMSAQ